MQRLAACAKCQTQYDVSTYTVGDSFHCACGTVVAVMEPRVHEARLVRCAACGSTRGKGGTNCEYCGARYSSVDKGWGSMCPGCFCRLPNDAQFCVECGLKINPQKLGDVRADLKCPRCAIPIHQRSIDGIEIFECGGCAGLWLPVATFSTLIDNKKKLDTALRGLNAAATKRGRKNKFEITESEEVKYVPCPTCQALMNRRNFARVSGVIIDTCRDCGVWLDNQELNRIVQFVEAGGMDKAREFESREREHNEKMREKRKKPVPMMGVDGPITMGGHSATSGNILGPILARAVGEIARSFLRG
jgi:Zn-finger nucleic acid-binding protein